MGFGNSFERGININVIIMVACVAVTEGKPSRANDQDVFCVLIVGRRGENLFFNKFAIAELAAIITVFG